MMRREIPLLLAVDILSFFFDDDDGDVVVVTTLFPLHELVTEVRAILCL